MVAPRFPPAAGDGPARGAQQGAEQGAMTDRQRRPPSRRVRVLPSLPWSRRCRRKRRTSSLSEPEGGTQARGLKNASGASPLSRLHPYAWTRQGMPDGDVTGTVPWSCCPAICAYLKATAGATFVRTAVTGKTSGRADRTA